MSLQHDLLPRAVPDVAGLDLSVRYLPGEAGSHAGGDWYDIFELDANRVGLVVGDEYFAIRDFTEGVTT